MRRREFITLLGGAAVVLPNGARAQGLRRIGVLMGNANDAEGQERISAVEDSLSKLGWKTNSNTEIDIRWATPDSVRMLAREIIGLQPDVILSANTFSTAALSQETKTIPIVFVAVFDPLDAKLVTNIARPGGNVTGFTNHEPTMGGKWLQLLRELAPRVNKVVLLFNQTTAPFTKPFYSQYFGPAGQSIGIQTDLAALNSAADIEQTITQLAEQQDTGFVAMADPFTTVNRKLIVELATLRRVPALYPWPFLCQHWGARFVWTRPNRHIASCRFLSGSHSQGRETSGPPRSNANEI